MQRLILPSIVLMMFAGYSSIDERCGSYMGSKCKMCYDGFIKDTGNCAESTKKVD